MHVISATHNAITIVFFSYILDQKKLLKITIQRRSDCMKSSFITVKMDITTKERCLVFGPGGKCGLSIFTYSSQTLRKYAYSNI